LRDELVDEDLSAGANVGCAHHVYSDQAYKI
jgi:hypothetical protein